jgi:hypothetical protein
MIDCKKTLFPCAMVLLFAVAGAKAGGFVEGRDSKTVCFDPWVQFANVTVAARDAKTATVTFDISWTNSWRHGCFFDAAWVFFKARAGSAGEWRPVRLAADKVMNPVGCGQGADGTPLEFLVPAGGAAKSRPMSSADRKWGRFRPLRGLRSGLAGFVFTQPSRWPKAKKLRMLASLRAIVEAA